MCCSGRVTRELLGTSQAAQGPPKQTAAGGMQPAPSPQRSAQHPAPASLTQGSGEWWQR